MVSHDFASKRPTLPPLHTLDLPFPLSSKPRLQGFHAAHDQNSCHCSVASTSQHWCHTRRQVSGSSSRTSSPTPSDDLYAQSLTSLSPSTFPQTFRLVPCTFEEATAVVVVPPPSVTSPLPKGKPPSPLLFTGRSLNQFRHSRERFGKGARIHPYRIAPSARRPSSSSTSSE